MMKTILEQLVLHEGERLKPYRCTSGKLTIGVGRNIDDNGISHDEAMHLLANDVHRCEVELDRALPWWRQLSDVRQKVLVDMAFNMGLPGLLSFKNTLRFMERGEFGRAADNMLASLWTKQVKGRAIRLAAMMRTGVDYGA